MRSRPAKKPMTTTLICDCNKTMPLEPKTLGAALAETLPLHSTLCRREAPAFQRAIQSGDEVVVACTQEKRLFGELGAADAEGATSPIRFVNIRETGGWSRDASERHARRSPRCSPRPACRSPSRSRTVSYKSQGRLLVVGALDEAERAAALLADTLRGHDLLARPRQRGRRAGAPLARGRAAASMRSPAGSAPSSCAGRATTRSTSTSARAATPAWPRAPSRPSAWTTRSTTRSAVAPRLRAGLHAWPAPSTSAARPRRSRPASTWCSTWAPRR